MSGMFGSCRRIVPMASALRYTLRQPAQVRNFWDFGRSSDLRSLARDMERQVERLEREMMNNFPFNRVFPRFIPIAGSSSSPNTFRFNVDVSGFKPEEIQVNLKDRVLTLKAKMDRTSEDGSKVSQDIMRQMTLPPNVKVEELKSYLHDGVLTIEAPCESEAGPKEIPIGREEPSKISSK